MMRRKTKMHLKECIHESCPVEFLTAQSHCLEKKTVNVQLSGAVGGGRFSPQVPADDNVCSRLVANAARSITYSVVQSPDLNLFQTLGCFHMKLTPLVSHLCNLPLQGLFPLVSLLSDIFRKFLFRDIGIIMAGSKHRQPKQLSRARQSQRDPDKVLPKCILYTLPEEQTITWASALWKKGSSVSWWGADQVRLGLYYGNTPPPHKSSLEILEQRHFLKYCENTIFRSVISGLLHQNFN